ncbi:membrane protein, partial [gut metagenome]
VLYVAVLVALRKPIWAKCAKTLLLIMFICGTAVVFSKISFTDMSFWQAVVALYEQGQGVLGGGVLGGFVGGTLLILCGRPAANILLVVMLTVCVMWFAGVTPGDLWQLMEDRVEDARKHHETVRVARSEPRPRSERIREGREMPEIREESKERTELFSFRKCRPPVDVDLGPEPITQIETRPE